MQGKVAGNAVSDKEMAAKGGNKKAADTKKDASKTPGAKASGTAYPPSDVGLLSGYECNHGQFCQKTLSGLHAAFSVVRPPHMPSRLPARRSGGHGSTAEGRSLQHRPRFS